jgi:hypothetical protein
VILRLAIAVALAGLAGCRPTPPPPVPAAAAPEVAVAGSLRFTAAAREAGVRFRLGNGGRSPLTILETAGGGCAFFDADDDARPDLLLVGPGAVALYHNRGNGTFADVTQAAGLGRRDTWMGCATGDVDGDGRPDLLLTGYRCLALYRNLGGLKFADVTRQWGLSALPWTMSAALADLNLDGTLDLYLSQYLRFDRTTPQICALGSIQSACGPEVYEPLSGRLLWNRNGRFVPEPGWRDTGKTWGVLVSHLLDSPRPAIYLANDMVPGDLWVWQGGRWRNRGPATGTAYDGQGHLQGGMGVDAGDYDRDGRLDLVVTTFFAQPTSLYHNDGNGLFTVTSGPAGLGAPTMPLVGFGVAFADFDNDGWEDLIIANGHVRDNTHQFDAAQAYRQRLQVFRNEGGRFRDVSATALPPDLPPLVGRGLSVADYDADGRLDVAIVDLEGEAVLLRNASQGGKWLQVRLRQVGSNRDALGARVTLRLGEATLVREVRTSGGLLSSFFPVAAFGGGATTAPGVLTVTWPDGLEETLPPPQWNRRLLVAREERQAVTPR